MEWAYPSPPRLDTRTLIRATNWCVYLHPPPQKPALLTTSIYAQVKNVYLLSPIGSLIERQSPYKTKQGVWGNDNLSGQHTTSNTTSLFSYWYQDFDTRLQILAVFFQDFGANSLTITKYVENVTEGKPWETARQSMDIQDGSSIVGKSVV